MSANSIIFVLHLLAYLASLMISMLFQSSLITVASLICLSCLVVFVSSWVFHNPAGTLAFIVGLTCVHNVVLASVADQLTPEQVKILTPYNFFLAIALLGLTYYIHMNLSYIDWPFVYGAIFLLIIAGGLRYFKKWINPMIIFVESLPVNSRTWFYPILKKYLSFLLELSY